MAASAGAAPLNQRRLAATITARALRGRPSPEISSAAKAAGILTIAGLATGVSNLAFNIVVARSGGAEIYGGIGTLLSLVTVASYLAIGTGYAVARRAALNELNPRIILRRSARTMVPWFVLVVPVVLAAPGIAAFLRLPSSLPVVIALGTILTMLVSSLATGILIGRRRFRLYAALTIGSAMTRVFLGAVLPRFIETTDAALLATMVPIVGVCIGAVLLVRRIGGAQLAPRGFQPTTAQADIGEGLPRDSIAGALGSMALWAVWAAPLVAARHDLPSAESGRFAAAQVLASAVLFIVAPITMAFFPTIARHRDHDAVAMGMIASASLALLGAAALVLLGPLFMTHVYGSQFSTPRGLFLAFGLSAALVAVATFALWAARARHGRRSRVTVVALVALALEAIAGGLFHPTAEVLAVTPFAALMVVTTAGLLGGALRGGGIRNSANRLVGVRVASIKGDT